MVLGKERHVGRFEVGHEVGDTCIIISYTQQQIIKAKHSLGLIYFKGVITFTKRFPQALLNTLGKVTHVSLVVAVAGFRYYIGSLFSFPLIL